ncbi:MAG: FKBP-type peptidyl-prolyl cis-trans isomerase [Prevotella sp.]|nr:FKBP-type peptidyl-prolyl cis-trans isomerase [Prevotella sp.]
MKREYKKMNEEWLDRKSKEEGIYPLSKGVFYQVLKQGDGSSAQPAPRDIITVHYTGWTIDGRKFDSSRGETPLAIRLSDLIEGWIIALQQMHVGDQWKIFVPAEMGYGKFSQPGIPANSTLIFEIELLGIA